MVSQDCDTELICHQLTSNDASSDLVERILDLARTIFNPDEPTNAPEPDPALQLSTWQTHLKDSSAVILYTMDSASSKPTAFFFGYPRTMPEIGHEAFHIWIAAVDPASRGLGLFPFLLERTKQYAQALGHTELSVCTYPKRFEKMYRILGQYGWQEVAWREQDKKVFMKLQI